MNFRTRCLCLMSGFLLFNLSCQSTVSSETSSEKSQRMDQEQPQQRILFKLLSDQEISSTENLGRMKEATSLRNPRVKKLEVAQDEAAGILESLQNDPAVEWAAFDELLPAAQIIVDPIVLPNDPLFETQDHLRVIQAPQAWSRFTTGKTDVKVVVCDTGISVSHEDLIAQTSQDSCIDIPTYAQGDCSVKTAHGTRVAGVIAAEGNNNVGVSGVAWKAQLVPVQAASVVSTDSQGQEKAFAYVSDIVDCIDYAAFIGANVVNISFDTVVAGGVNPAIADAATRAEDEGLIVVAAGGNTNSPTSKNSSSIVHVGSTNSSGMATFSSNASAHIDLVAPGENIATTDAVVLCKDANNNQNRDPGECQVQLNKYAKAGVSGTSFAAPQVSGAVALMKSYFPAATPAEIRCALTSTAADRGVPGRDDTFGHGLLQVESALTKLREAQLNGRPSLAVSTKYLEVSANQQFTLTATALDPEQGNLSNKVMWRMADDTTFVGSTLTTRIAKGGQYTLVATAIDSACNASSETITVMVFNDPPKITLVNPTQTLLKLKPYETFLASAVVTDLEDGDLSHRVVWKQGGKTLMVGSAVSLWFAQVGAYEVSLTVTDSGGASAGTAFTVLVELPPLPLDATDLRISTFIPKRASIYWRDVANNETGYIVERAIVYNLWGRIGEYVEIDRLPANSQEYHDSIKPGTYAYRIKAFNEAGASNGVWNYASVK